MKKELPDEEVQKHFKFLWETLDFTEGSQQLNFLLSQFNF